jgi:hypothetical protein
METLKDVASSFERLKQTRAACDAVCLLAQLYLSRGEPKRAREELDRARGLAERGQYMEGKARCDALTAGLALLQSDLETARREFEAAREVFAEMDCPHDEAVCTLGLAEVNLYTGHPLDSQTLAMDAAQLFRRIGASRDQLVAEAMVARSEYAVSSTPRFRESWLAATRVLAQAGAPLVEVDHLVQLAATEPGSMRSDLWLESVREEAGQMTLVGPAIAADAIEAIAAGRVEDLEGVVQRAKDQGLLLLVSDIERWRLR